MRRNTDESQMFFNSLQIKMLDFLTCLTMVYSISDAIKLVSLSKACHKACVEVQKTVCHFVHVNPYHFNDGKQYS